MISTTEAAARLNVTPATIVTYIKSGFLRATRLPGGHYRIDENSVRQFELQTAEQAVANDR